MARGKKFPNINDVADDDFWEGTFGFDDEGDPELRQVIEESILDGKNKAWRDRDYNLELLAYWYYDQGDEEKCNECIDAISDDICRDTINNLLGGY